MRGIELIYKPVMVRDEEKGSLGSSPSGTTRKTEGADEEFLDVKVIPNPSSGKFQILGVNQNQLGGLDGARTLYNFSTIHFFLSR